VIPELAELLDELPDGPVAFEGSDFPLPLCQAVLGRVPSPDEVRRLVEETDPDDAGHLALHAAMAAECLEAAQPDARELFVSDASLRGNVFMGSKWRAGWTFVLGQDTAQLQKALDERSFMVFPGGPRPTQPVYWLQMMVRYAMVWGRIPPGEDHEMGHFLEDDLPGVLIVRNGATEMECLLALAMMKMGCPAIVPTDFPYEDGRQARTDDDADVLDAIATLPNMRVLEVGGERIALPEFCDPAHAREDFEAATAIGGDDQSFLVVRAADVDDGTEVVGSPDGSIGIEIGIGDERLDLDVSQHLEKIALGLPGYLPGVRVTNPDPLTIGLAEGAELAPERLAETIRAGLKWNFPRLERIHVRLIFDEGELAKALTDIAAFRRRRADELARRSEDNVYEFVACIECQSFSHSHVCIVTPDRVPMCGRDPGQVKCAALFGATWHPWKRRGLESQELREVILKGRCLDAERGEYEGVNEAARRLSRGVIERIFLHSLEGFPHSSCGCFHYLAFRIDGFGTGVMNRGFRGTAPNGETWDSLANKAGGKQADGVSGLSLGYLRSPKFLQGDGGLAGVVWMPYDVLEQVRDLLPPDALPATEKDAATLGELTEFVERRGRTGA
jgi:acetyl-CoA decarbonylase/synthase complex subunit beta